MVTYIQTIEEFDKILAKAKEEGKAVLVDYTAAWCGPCKMISPILEHLAAEADKSKIEFYKVDVDEAAAISEREGITAMPTFRVYNSREPNPGKDYAELRGANKARLEGLISTSISVPA